MNERKDTQTVYCCKCGKPNLNKNGRHIGIEKNRVWFCERHECQKDQESYMKLPIDEGQILYLNDILGSYFSKKDKIRHKEYQVMQDFVTLVNSIAQYIDQGHVEEFVWDGDRAHAKTS